MAPGGSRSDGGKDSLPGNNCHMIPHWIARNGLEYLVGNGGRRDEEVKTRAGPIGKFEDMPPAKKKKGREMTNEEMIK